MTEAKKKKKDARVIIRELQEEWEIPLTAAASRLLDRLEINGNPAGTRPEHPQLAAALGSLYRPSVLISWNSQNTLGKQCRFGQRSSDRTERTPEQEQSARKRAVQRAEKELVALGILTVLKNAAPSHRADRRSNLYALDLEACQSLTEQHRCYLVEPEKEAYETTPVLPRDSYGATPVLPRESLRGNKEEAYGATPVLPKDQLLIKDQFFSQDQTNEKEDHLCKPLRGLPDETEIVSALIEAGYSRKADDETLEAARELMTLYASPEAIKEAQETWETMGRTYRLGLKGLVRNWEAIAGSSFDIDRMLPAAIVERVREIGKCYCGGSLYLMKVQEWEEGERTTYLCPRVHNFQEHKKPSPQWLWSQNLTSVDDEELFTPWSATLKIIEESAKDESPEDARCSCGGKLWLESPWGKVLCFRFHDDEGKPDEVKWKVHALEETARRKKLLAEARRQEKEKRKQEKMSKVAV